MSLDIFTELKDAKSVGITGHIKPDGDCIGSCLALLRYIQKRFPEIKAELFLEKPERAFDHIPYRELINSDFPEREPLDVFVICDTNYERTGEAKKYFDAAKKRLNIDHHESSPQGTGDVCLVEPEAPACAEIIYKLIPGEYLDKDIAELLYMGIAHDTGVFHFSNTRPETLRICAELITYGFDFSTMLDETFFSKTLPHNRMLGRVLSECRLYYDGKLIFGSADRKQLKTAGATRDDTGGTVERLRITEGVQCAMFVYEKKPGEWKASMRASSDLVNVAKVGEVFGGGGHNRAAGCEYRGSLEDFERLLVEEAGKQIEGNV
ncbi:MAG: bifunctional oligoribonuclease/PAP phosphatase NrnA [Lachnospiraceae bacterium]|nr:bifunctional oligoribonuclease/PAP phosphatase NrnA [Lachnospiraceae bacterium]